MTSSSSSSNNNNAEASFDLTAQISPYLDRHLVFPLLEFIDTLIDENKISYNKKDIAAARLALLRPTHMVDYAMDVHSSSLNNGAAPPAEMEEQKKAVYKQLEDLRQGCAPLVALCQDEEQRNKLNASGQWNLAGIAEHDAKITPEMVGIYKQLARFNYDCGDYKQARDMLTQYISLFAFPPAPTVTEEDEDLIAAGLQQQQQQQQQRDSGAPTITGNPAIYYLQSKDMDDNMLQVLWGRLACEILEKDWEAAAVGVDAVRAAMESMVSAGTMDPLKALQQRTWLLHWSLFVYWNENTKGGLEQLVELFCSERYKQAITTNAPHLLRYLTAAVLLCKRRITKYSSQKGGLRVAAAGSNPEARRLLKNLVYVMQDCEYSDPIVQFVDALSIQFDFEAAQTKLAECERVLSQDFFLCHQTDLFMEEARVFVFENYCRIHHKIDFKALGEKLAMDQQAAEKWMVNLIRHADLDAKIDSGAGCVVMGTGSQQTVVEQVMERTRELNVRSAILAQNLQNLWAEARKEKVKREKAAREEDYY